MRGLGSILAVLACCAGFVGCGKEATSDAGAPQSPTPAQATGTPRPQLGPLVVFLGDSLTAGHGLPSDQSYPARLSALLAAEGHPVRIVNAGVSGDTTAGGLRRLNWLLDQKPDVLVVGLGGNDGLRGLSPEETRANLREIAVRAQAAGARVLLLGMQLPPNYGSDYTGRFAALYPALAREENVPLVPFLLEGVGGDPALNLADGIHPNAQGQERVARNVLPYLRELLN